MWKQLRIEIINGNLSAILLILKKSKLDVDACDPENGWPLYFYCIKYHQVDLFKYLIDFYNDKTFTTDFNRNSGLMIAAEYSSNECFFALLEKYSFRMVYLGNLDGKTCAQIGI